MIDKNIFNFENSYSRLPNVFFTEQLPSKYINPELVLLNNSLIKSLDLDLDLNSNDINSNNLLDILSGNKILESSLPIAQAYAGHQFGHFNILGDGRAILLGEHITSKGERFDVQLKGAGKTPYSRGGDGKAALGPMLREYIISEAMNALNIPTTRSLAVIKTGEKIMREKELDAALLVRIAESHLRVGTFAYARNVATLEELKALADYAIERHFSEIKNDENAYLSLLDSVIKKQASLIAKWQLVGFIHGVMNTDNMTISGETIDYGPCAFMDVYDPKTVFSSIDSYGRYSYGNQPNIGLWNIARFAEAILPLINEDETRAIELAQSSISKFSKMYKENWLEGMRKKLGLFNKEEIDEVLIESLLSIMQKYKIDYTNMFYNLTTEKIKDEKIYSNDDFTTWFKLWNERLERQVESKEESKKLMRENNPVIIPRNHRVEESLEYAINGDYNSVKNLINATSNPYDYTSDLSYYSKPSDDSLGIYKTYCGT